MDTIKYEPSQYYKYAYKFDFAYDKLSFCRNLKDRLGWQHFGYTDDAWRSDSIDPMVSVKRKYPNTNLDDTVALEISMILDAEHKKISELEKIPDQHVPIPELKATLRQYQENTVAFFLNNGGRGLMCLDPGCGKTVCSLAYALATKKEKILVMCPNSMKGTWADEVKKFTGLKPFIFRSGQDYDEIDFSKYQVFIINYDILDRFLDMKSVDKIVKMKDGGTKKVSKVISMEPNKLFRSLKLDLLIADEATMIKSYTAQRTVKAVQLSREFQSILLLTGTPIINSPKDLFIPLNIIDNSRFNSFFKFAYRFCDPVQQKWGWDFSGSSNMEELRSMIKPYYVRYAKRDVLKDLPPTIFTDMPVELHSGFKSRYKMALENLVEYLKEIRKKTDAETKKSMQAEKLVMLNELRQITSMNKIEDAEEIIQNIVDSGEKVIVFSNFHEPLNTLHEIFKKNSVILLGDSSEKDREDAKNRFQSDEQVRIFFGGTRASGMGITLNRSENVLFIDQPWTAADYEQAYSRAERMGNKSEVINIRTMYVIGSVDEKIANIIKKKKNLSDFIFDADYDTNIINEVLTSLSEE